MTTLETPTTTDELSAYELHERVVVGMTISRGSVETAILGRQLGLIDGPDYELAKVLQNLDFTLWRIGLGGEVEVLRDEFRDLLGELPSALAAAGFPSTVNVAISTLYADGLRESEYLGQIANRLP